MTSKHLKELCRRPRPGSQGRWIWLPFSLVVCFPAESKSAFVSGARESLGPDQSIERLQQIDRGLAGLAQSFKTFSAVHSALETQTLPLLRNKIVFDRAAERWGFQQLLGEKNGEKSFGRIAKPPVQSRTRILERIELELREIAEKKDAAALRRLCLTSLPLYGQEPDAFVLCSQAVSQAFLALQNPESRALLLDFSTDRALWPKETSLLMAVVLSSALMKSGEVDLALEVLRGERERSLAAQDWRARSFLREAGILYASGRPENGVSIWRALAGKSGSAEADLALSSEFIDPFTRSMALLSLARVHRVRSQHLRAVQIYREVLGDPENFESDLAEPNEGFFAVRSEKELDPSESRMLSKFEVESEFAEALLEAGKANEALSVFGSLSLTPGIVALRKASREVVGRDESLSLSVALKQMLLSIDEDKVLVGSLRSQARLRTKSLLTPRSSLLPLTALGDARTWYESLRSSSIATLSLCEVYGEFAECKQATEALEKWKPLIGGAELRLNRVLRDVSDVLLPYLDKVEKSEHGPENLMFQKVKTGLKDLYPLLLKLAQEKDRFEKGTEAVSIKVAERGAPGVQEIFSIEVAASLVAADDKVFQIREQLKGRVQNGNKGIVRTQLSVASAENSSLQAKLNALKHLVYKELSEQLVGGAIGRKTLSEYEKEIRELDQEIASLERETLVENVLLSQALAKDYANQELRDIPEGAALLIQLSAISKLIGTLKESGSMLPGRNVWSQAFRTSVDSAERTFISIQDSLDLAAATQKKQLIKVNREVDGILEESQETLDLFSRAQLTQLGPWRSDLIFALEKLERSLEKMSGELSLALVSAQSSGVAALEKEQVERSENFLKRAKLRSLQRWKLENGVLR